MSVIRDGHKSGFRSSPAIWVAGVLAVSLLVSSTLVGESAGWRVVLLALGMLPAGYYVARVAGNRGIGPANRRRLLMVILAIHAIATLYFFPLPDIVNDQPVVTLDHSFHYYQAVRARDVFWDTFRFDRYDPYFMAGYPGGTIFDLDMKGAELFCALVPVASVARVLKMFILAAYLTMVLSVYWGSRLQGFRIDESMLGLLLLLAWWHWGRPYAGDFRYAGMFSFVFVSHLCFLLVGLLKQFARGSLVKTFFGLGPIAFLIHPTSAILLPVPFAVSIAANRRFWTLRKWMLLAAWCAVVVFVNSLWLRPFFEYLWMKTTTELYYQVHGASGLYQLLCKPTCLLALSLFSLAVVGLVAAARERRLSTAMPAAAGALFLLFVAAAGVYMPGIRQLEPGRFLVPVFVFLSPLAGAGLRWLAVSAARWTRNESLKRRARTAAIVGLTLVMLPLSLLESKSFYHHTIKTTCPESVASLIEAVGSRVSPPGRLMIEDCPARYYGDIHLPALLPLVTGVEQIGGPYPHTYLLYYFSAFRWEETFGRPVDRWDPGSLRQYLDLYNIRWVVTATPRSARAMRRLLGKDPEWTRSAYALWETGAGPAEPADVTATMNHLTIRGPGDPRGYFIAYHWVQGLSASGAAKIRPVQRLDDPVPFIFVEPNGEKDINITF